MPVQGNIHMLVGAGDNVTVQTGPEGIVIVNSSYETLAPKILAAIRKLSDKPIFWIVNTSIDADHIGGNDALPKLANAATRQGVRVVAHENVVNRMTAAPHGADPVVPDKLWPNDEYFLPQKDFSFNGEAIVVYHMPDSSHGRRQHRLVPQFECPQRRRHLQSRPLPGDRFAERRQRQGLIAALNQILQLTVPLKYQEGGTYVIPGHGRICDEADVVEYRDMVTIIRDRMQDLIKKGMSLDQIKAARPSRDYDTEYGPGDAFVETVYKSLTAKK